MPLDASSYSLALLRLDGRRWNELRSIHATISPQPATDGSSHLEMGNTKVICTVTGPLEMKRVGQASTSSSEARIDVEIRIAGFSSVDRQKRSRNDKYVISDWLCAIEKLMARPRRVFEMQHILTSALSEVIHLHLYPQSTIVLTLHVLSVDGGLLAALINASTLALIDAGVPLSDYLVACTAGSTINEAASSSKSNRAVIPGLSSLSDEIDDPLLDLSGLEEQDLPFITIATIGLQEPKVMVAFTETRMMPHRLEEMMAVGIDGCKMVRQILDDTIKQHGEKMLESS